MDSIQFVMPTMENVEQLVTMRLFYIEEDFGKITEEQSEKIKTALPDYFARNLGKSCLVFAAKDHEKIIATAMLILEEKPANPSFPTGMTGEVLSVYTKPEYRRKGISGKLMSMLLKAAKDKKCNYVKLLATRDGYPLYKRLGFEECPVEDKYTAMRYYL